MGELVLPDIVVSQNHGNIVTLAREQTDATVTKQMGKGTRLHILIWVGHFLFAPPARGSTLLCSFSQIGRLACTDHTLTCLVISH